MILVFLFTIPVLAVPCMLLLSNISGRLSTAENGGVSRIIANSHSIILINTKPKFLNTVLESLHEVAGHKAVSNEVVQLRI